MCRLKSLLWLVVLMGWVSGALMFSDLVTGTESPVASPVPRGARGQSSKSQLLHSYGKLPLHFEANQGQTDPQVKFLSRGQGYTLFLTATEAVLAVPHLAVLRPDNEENAQTITGTTLRMQLVGANPAPEIVGLDALQGKSHYLIGNDPTAWRTGIPHYAKVKYEAIYPGIDLVYYGNQRRLEYDFIVAPGADPTAITLDIQGADTLEMDAQGNLVLRMRTAGGHVHLRKPVIYQDIDGVRRDIGGGYILKGPQQVGFQMAAYDVARPLVVDPVLVYSTYVGGSNMDEGFCIAVDASGHAYMVGRTISPNFPTVNPFQSAFGGGGADVVVAKLNPAGTALIYSTYLGGSGADSPGCIAVDTDGNAYVAGSTNSPNFPTVNPFQSTFGGSGARGFGDAFVAKLNPTGSALVYSTYLGGSGDDGVQSIAVDSTGHAYVSGQTESSNFPTANPFQSTFGGGGDDAFVAKLNPTGNALIYSTYLGGSDTDLSQGNAIDTDGNAYVIGQTFSNNFPTATPLQPTFGGARDAFVAKLNPTGSALVYSTYLGGSGVEFGLGIAVDTDGNAYVVGSTSSSNFPTANPLQPAFGGGGAGGFGDAFVAKLNPTGSALVYSTYLGGSNEDGGSGIAVDAFGNAYVAGSTDSPNFPTVSAVQPAFGGVRDAFVAKIGEPCPTVSIVSNFNGTPIKAGNFIWFNSVLKVKGLSATPVTISLRNATIQFTANSTEFNVSVPDADITFDPNATAATTSFEAATDMWETTVPSFGLSGNTFLTGQALPITTDLPGGINPVTWNAQFFSDTPGVTVAWKWAAAVYSNFTTDLDTLGVKPVDDYQASAYKNSDHAGTPENFKQFVIGGARGGGGSNFTGSYSGTKTVEPCE